MENTHLSLQKGTRFSYTKKTNLIGWLFVIVPIVFIIWFYFYPMIQAFLLSLQSGAGRNMSYVGISNYERLFSDKAFVTSVKNTFIYLIVQVPIMILFALFFSVLLNNRYLKGRSFFRTAIFLPCITSLVAYSIVFKNLFGVDGLVNTFLMNTHLVSEPVGWITNGFWAKITIIIAITWRWTGYNMIFYLSALQNIDTSLFEAAKIDGASAFQQFKKITIPLLKPIILFTSIISTIGTLQLFDEVMNITNGGPANATLSISQYIYFLSFRYTPDFGYAATVSYVILILIIILTFIQFKTAGDSND